MTLPDSQPRPHLRVLPIVTAPVRPRLVQPRVRPMLVLHRTAAPAAHGFSVGPVVHEMRNFLAPMAAAIELLSLRHAQDADSSRAVDMLRRQTLALERLVSDLLDVSRVAAGKLQLRKERCELQEIVRRTVEMCTPAAQARSQQVLVEAADESVPVDADPMRLGQAAANLVFNAIRHSPAGAAIRLRVSSEPGWAVLEVSDVGDGISTDLRSRMFELGAQARDGDHGGLGIGLHLVRSIAQLHGGSADAWSAGQGQGSRFTIRLPLAG